MLGLFWNICRTWATPMTAGLCCRSLLLYTYISFVSLFFIYIGLFWHVSYLSNDARAATQRLFAFYEGPPLFASSWHDRPQTTHTFFGLFMLTREHSCFGLQPRFFSQNSLLYIIHIIYYQYIMCIYIVYIWNVLLYIMYTYHTYVIHTHNGLLYIMYI
jgi:hypothetical protein